MKGKTVITKPVSTTCNAHCDYCYNLTTSFRTLKAIPRMEVDTAMRMQEELLRLGYDRVRMVWHGGEPLLRGLSFYAKVMECQERLRQKHPGVCIENGMQSNLTLLDETWCAFLKEHHIVIGTSLDGWAELHNAHRKYSNGKGAFDDAMRGLKLADRYGILGGFIAVVNDQTVKQDPRVFFEYLVSVCPRAEITPCWEAGDTKDQVCTVKPVQFLSFVMEMFDAWWMADDSGKRVRMFAGVMQALLGGQDFTCAFKGNCGDFLALEADGSVYPCGKFSGVPEFLLGNINQQDLDEILAYPIYNAFLELRTNLPPKCQACQWKRICNNGCSYERYLGGWRFAETSPFCEVWDGLYAHVQGRIQVLQTSLAQRA